MSRSEQAIESEWPQFVDLVHSRLRVGAVEYGDTSFNRDPVELLDEIDQELADVAGWSFILRCQLKEIRRKLQNVGKGEEVPTNLSR